MAQVPPFALFGLVASSSSDTFQVNNAKGGTSHAEARHVSTLSVGDLGGRPCILHLVSCIGAGELVFDAFLTPIENRNRIFSV